MPAEQTVFFDNNKDLQLLFGKYDQNLKLIEQEMGKKAKKNLMPLQAGDVTETIADWSKAHKALGFAPKTSMQTGIAEFVAWFRENEKFLQSLGEPKQ